MLYAVESHPALAVKLHREVARRAAMSPRAHDVPAPRPERDISYHNARNICRAYLYVLLQEHHGDLTKSSAFVCFVVWTRPFAGSGNKAAARISHAGAIYSRYPLIQVVSTRRYYTFSTAITF